MNRYNYITTTVEFLTEDEVLRMETLLVEGLAVDQGVADHFVHLCDLGCKYLGREEAWATDVAGSPSKARRAWNGDAEKRRGFQQAAEEMLRHWHNLGRLGQLAFAAKTSKHVAGHVPGFRKSAESAKEQVADLLNGFPIHVLPLIEELLAVLASVAGNESTHQTMRKLPTNAEARRYQQTLAMANLLILLPHEDAPLDRERAKKRKELCRVAFAAHNRARGWVKPSNFERVYRDAVEDAGIV